MSDKVDTAAGGPEVVPRLGALESDVMDELWAQGGATARSVLEALNASSERERAYTTILTVLHRLGQKGLAVRRRRGRVDVFTAAHSREEYRETRAAAEVAALVERYGDAALVAFARALEGTHPGRRARS
jgi:BlaI family transcriptional regulator, penicillinase repressor